MGESITVWVEAALRSQEGPTTMPDPTEFAQLLLDHLPLRFGKEAPNELSELTGPFWSDQKVLEALGLGSPRRLRSRRTAGALLGLATSDGATIYPVWQFVRTGAGVEVRSDLRPMLRALRSHDGWAVAVLLCTPQPELDDISPIEWSRAGNAPRTLTELALVVNREWSQGSRPPV